MERQPARISDVSKDQTGWDGASRTQHQEAGSQTIDPDLLHLILTDVIYWSLFDLSMGGGRWAVGGGAPFSLSLVQLAPKLVKEDARIVVWSHQIDPVTVERSLASMDWFSLWVPSFTTTMTTLVTFRRFLVKDLILFSNGGWIQDPCLFQPNISPSHPHPASFFFSGFLANFFFLFFKFFSFSFSVLAFRIFQDFYDCWDFSGFCRISRDSLRSSGIPCGFSGFLISYRNFFRIL